MKDERWIDVVVLVVVLVVIGSVEEWGLLVGVPSDTVGISSSGGGSAGG